MYNLKAGFVGFGEVNSPRDIIEDKCNKAMTLLKSQGMELVATQPVTDDYEENDIKRAVSDLKKDDFDFLIICIAGWIPTHAVIKVISKFREKPMVLWGLSGFTENGRLVTTADQAGTTALRKVMEDMGYKFKYVFNMPERACNIEKIIDYGKAASAAARLKDSRIGMMGYRDMNLYGTLHDGVSLKAKVGPEVEVFEMLEVQQRIENIDPAEVREVIDKYVKGKWKFENEIGDSILQKGSEYYLAIRQIVNERKYDAVSLKDVDGMKKLARFTPAMIFMLLADEPGICTIPENDSLGAVTQLIVKYLTGQAAAYLEFYEFMEDRVLVGVPDYVPASVVNGPVKVMFAGFGDFCQGLLNISEVKTGRVTFCRLTSKGDRYAMHIVTGNAVKPRKWEEAGWKQPAPQLPGLEIILDIPVEEFADKVMSQHYIISYGDNTRALKDLCNLLDIDIIV